MHQTDRLSARVCHACISYLNSWQSFKNRCHVAQKKQNSMLELFVAKQRSQQNASGGISPQKQRQLDQHRANQLQQQRILKQALSQPTMAAAAANNASLLTNNRSNTSAIDVVSFQFNINVYGCVCFSLLNF